MKGESKKNDICDELGIERDRGAQLIDKMNRWTQDTRTVTEELRIIRDDVIPEAINVEEVLLIGFLFGRKVELNDLQQEKINRTIGRKGRGAF